MKCETFDIKVSGSEEYAKLNTYIQESHEEVDVHQRPFIIVCPGGAYMFTSHREAEMIALQFVANGFNAAVLWYSYKPAVYPTANLELGRSFALIREHAKEWDTDPNKISVIGFSAGGHMVASYCCFWNKPFMAEKLGVDSEVLRPNALLLGYPVITSGEYAHHDSFHNLLADKYDEMKDEMSLETQVTAAVPRTFIWHTTTDEAVPVQNSLYFVTALIEKGISVEYHLFEKGGHGLGLADERTIGVDRVQIEPNCQCWIDMAIRWLKNL